MTKRIDYVFSKTGVIQWITDSEPVIHCNDCQYYDSHANICKKLLDSQTMKPMRVQSNRYCDFGIENDLPF